MSSKNKKNNSKNNNRHKNNLFNEIENPKKNNSKRKKKNNLIFNEIEKPTKNNLVLNEIGNPKNNNLYKNNLIFNDTENPKNNNSKRTKKMSKKGINNFKSECSYFWDKNNKNYKKKDKINILCKPNKKTQKIMYGKELDKYKFIGYENNFNRCLTLYNTYSKNFIDKDKICKNQDDKLIEFKEVMNYLESFVYKKINVEPRFKLLFELIFTYTQPNNIDYLELLNEILRGAYCIVDGDNGYIYTKIYSKLLKNKFKFKKNVNFGKGGFDGFSSHFSYGDHYRLGWGSLFNDKGMINNNFDFLIGRRPVLEEWAYKIDKKSSFMNYQGDTWFQFEESRNESLTNKLRHTGSTIKYIASGILSYATFGYTKLKNIGPFGKSIYTEYNPLVIKTCGWYDKKSNNTGYKDPKICDIKLN